MSEERPTVRLAVAPRASDCNGNSPFEVDRPVVRLACNGQGQGEANGSPFVPRPTVRLAVNGPRAEAQAANGSDQFEAQPGEPEDVSDAPALLVSYVYAEKVRALMPRWRFRDWVLDSGAFSAFNSGTEIRLQDYIDYCKRALEADPKLTEVFALDVIGDWRASLRNTEEMWRQGVQAIPCYHWGEPQDVLRGMARDYPKIALGGVALKVSAKKVPWAKRCFDRIWPCRVHGFAYCSETALMAVPWDSVDATNWQIGPTKFGSWKSVGVASWRGSQQNLRSEVAWYMALERRARARWAQTWAGFPAGR